MIPQLSLIQCYNGTVTVMEAQPCQLTFRCHPQKNETVGEHIQLFISSAVVCLDLPVLRLIYYPCLYDCLNTKPVRLAERFSHCGHGIEKGLFTYLHTRARVHASHIQISVCVCVFYEHFSAGMANPRLFALKFMLYFMFVCCC